MVDKKSHAPISDNVENLYEIKLKGHLDENWEDWLGGLEISNDEHGYSLLTGIIPDQAALHGILLQIRDLGLTLISIAPKYIDNETSKRDGRNAKRNSE